MVIPEKDLIKVNNPSLGLNLLVHPKARVQIAVYKEQPDKAFVQEIDGIGNVKKQTEFSGYLGFWNATAKFEQIIAEVLGIKEVDGLEVGMIIELNQDTKRYKKGDIIAIMAVDENGVATETQRLNKQQIERVKKSPFVSKLRKGEDLSFLQKQGIRSINDIDAFKTYSFGLIPDNETLIPLTYNYRGLKAQDKLKVAASKGGGEVEIQQLVFYTDTGGKTQIAANVTFEDGSIGRMPLKDFMEKPEKKTKAAKQNEQTIEGGLKKPNKKTPYYALNVDTNEFVQTINVKPISLSVEGDFFLAKAPFEVPVRLYPKWAIFEGITGQVVGVGKTKEIAISQAEENFQKHPEFLQRESLIERAKERIGVSPRYQ